MIYSVTKIDTECCFGLAGRREGMGGLSVPGMSNLGDKFISVMIITIGHSRRSVR